MPKEEVEETGIREELPEYLRNSNLFTDEEIWKNIEHQFEDLNDTLLQIRLETKEQAIPTKVGNEIVDKGVYWQDDALGAKARSWLQIPYDPTRDKGHVLEIWEIAIELGEKLESQIKSRQWSVELLNNWGLYCGYAAIIEYEYLQGRPNLQHVKGAASQNLDSHRKWLAHVYMELKEDGDKRVDTDGKVLDFLRELLTKGEFSDPQFDRSWYDRFLNDSRDDFTSSFKQNKFSENHIKKLAKERIDDLPPTKL